MSATKTTAVALLYRKDGSKFKEIFVPKLLPEIRYPDLGEVTFTAEDKVLVGRFEDTVRQICFYRQGSTNRYVEGV